MAQIESKGFQSPEETRPFRDKGQVDVVYLNGAAVGRGTFDPGWRWSEHVKPIAGTDSCKVRHLGYVESGRMKVVMDDGSDIQVGPVTYSTCRRGAMPGRSRTSLAYSSTSEAFRATPSPS